MSHPSAVRLHEENYAIRFDGVSKSFGAARRTA